MTTTRLLVSTLAMSTMVFGSFALADNTGTEERLETLKESIVSVALTNQDRLDNFADVRAELTPLVEELYTYASTTFEQEKALKVGTWQQLWTDDADDLRANNGFQTVDRSKTYQVVFDDGVFYNISEIQTRLGRFTGFLKGAYTAEAPRFVLEFTDFKIRRGGVEQGNVGDFALRAKNDTLGGLFGIPGQRPFPDGPVGARGEIITRYIDDTLRIDEGQNYADGVIDLFVLARAQ